MKTLIRLFSLISLLALTFGAAGVTPASAATSTVTTNADSGAGSLRQAIASAAAGDTIIFDNDYTILLASELAINKNLTIDGGGHSVTVSGQNVTRVFNITAGTVAFNALTIANGNVQTTDCGSAGAYQCGGGMILQNSGVTVTVTNSTFSGNSATFGGGIFNSGTLNVTNSTFSGNSATFGGGIYNIGTLNVTNSTFSGNSATFGGGIYKSAGGVTVKNTLLANSAGSNCTGSITDGGGNLQFGGATANSCGASIPTADPLLGALGNYGGNTQTFPLLPGSPAIDAGISATCADVATVNSLDQRGVGRPAACDIGAFESRGFTLTTTGGDSQSAVINTAFTPLALNVTSAFGEPVNDGKVTFTPPGSGASAVITGSPATIASGAVSVTATANGTTGAYNVTASALGATSVNFALTNKAVPPGNALQFDGGTQYVTVPDDANLNFTGAFTLETWIYKNASFSGWSGIIRKGNYYLTGIQGTDKVRFGFVDNSLVDYYTDSLSDIPNNKWVHIAGVYDGANLNIYINGVLDSSTNIGSHTIQSSNLPLKLGENSGFFFNGKMDEFRVWNVARSQTQIQDNLTNVLTGTETGLAAYYNFDQAGGTTLPDLTVNGHDGTLVNSPTWVPSTAFNIWTGATNTAWATASNWSRGVVPTAADNLYIPAGGNQPVISSGSQACNQLVLESGSTLTINAFGFLAAKGNIYNNGSLTGDYYLIFSGATPQTVRGTLAGSVALQMDNPTSLILGSNLTIPANSQLNMNNGAINLNGYTLAYASGASLGYRGAKAWTTSEAEFPVLNGPSNFYASSSGGVTLHADRTLAGQVQIGLGTLNANNHNLTLGSFWANNGGTFIPGTGTVTFNGAGQYIYGSTTFYNLTKAVTSANTLTFQSGTTQTVTGALTLQGAAGKLLSLRSNATGAQWKINAQGSRSLAYLDVKDSNNINTTAMSAASSVDSGNNLNWLFPPAPGYGSTPASGSAIDISATQGTNASASLSISETGSAALTITGITFTGADAAKFSALPTSFTIADGGAAQDVTITCDAASAGMFSATLNVAHNAEGSPATYPLSCTVLAAKPTTQASSVTFSNVTTTSMTVNWTSGSGASRLVLMKSGGAVDSNPVDGTSYTTNVVFGSGAQIGTGNYVVYGGSGASVNITGLTAGTTYHVAVYEFNGTGGAENYLTTLPATGSKAAKSAPVITETDPQTVIMSEDGSPTAFSLTLNASDTDSDSITWSIRTAASHGTAGASGTGVSKAITYAPNANFNGSDSFVVQVTDVDGSDTITVNVTINAVIDTPIITWNNPASIVTGTALGGAQLNATANVAGAFIYTPAAGVILPVGTHILHVDFTPADAVNYIPTSKDVSITVTSGGGGGGGGSLVPTITASDGTYLDKVNVTWTPVSGASYYLVYRSESLGGVKIPTSGYRATSLVGDDVWTNPGVTYYYWVRACDAISCSDFSAPDTGWQGLPAPVISASNGTFPDKVQVTFPVVNWATSYLAYRSLSQDGVKIPTDGYFTIGPGGDDIWAAPGVTYYYWVKACNGPNCSTLSAYDTGWR